jgi:chromosome segregation ATPase
MSLADWLPGIIVAVIMSVAGVIAAINARGKIRQETKNIVESRAEEWGKTMSTENDRLRVRIDQADKRIDGLLNERDVMEKAVGAAAECSDKVRSDLAKQVAENDRFRVRIEQTEKSLSNLNAALDGARTRINDLERQIGILEQGNKNNMVEIRALKEQIAGLEKIIVTLETAVKGLREQLEKAGIVPLFNGKKS